MNISYKNHKINKNKNLVCISTVCIETIDNNSNNNYIV